MISADEDEVGADRRWRWSPSRARATARPSPPAPPRPRRGVVVTADPRPDLLGALVGQERAAEDSRIGSSHGRNCTEEQRRGQDEEQLVAQRADGDLLDDRQLARGRGPLEELRGHSGVVDHHARGLGARATGGGADVVDRRSGQLAPSPPRRRAGRRVLRPSGDPSGQWVGWCVRWAPAYRRGARRPYPPKAGSGDHGRRMTHRHLAILPVPGEADSRTAPPGRCAGRRRAAAAAPRSAPDRPRRRRRRPA